MKLSPDILWALIGVALIILEIFTTSFFLIFFGIAALLVAALVKWAGLESFSLQALTFALTGLAGILIFRRKIRESLKNDRGFSADVHQQLTLEEDIPAGQQGRVFYQGSPWGVVNSGSEDLHRGDKAIIVKTEGVKLFIHKSS